MSKILVANPKNYEAVKGERLELHFSILTLPVISNIQKQLITSQLAKDPHIKVLSVDYIAGDLIVNVEILDNPFPLILLIGSVTAILGGWFIWASLSKVYKIIDDPAIRSTINIGLIVVSAIVGLLVIKAVR